MIVRLYKDIVQQIHNILKVYRENDGIRFESIVQDFEQPGALRSADDLIELLGKLANEEPVETDLIDAIVGTLRLPYTTNRVSSSVLQNLREALMLPSELQAFIDALNGQWQCAVCSHTMTGGELGVLRRESGGPVSIRCLNCAAPEYVVCSNGKHQRHIPKAVIQRLARAQEGCEMCESEASNQAPATQSGSTWTTSALNTRGAAVAMPSQPQYLSVSGEIIRQWASETSSPTPPSTSRDIGQILRDVASPASSSVGQRLQNAASNLLTREQERTRRDAEVRAAEIEALNLRMSETIEPDNWYEPELDTDEDGGDL